MEQDDLDSLTRYLLYTNELDTQGIVYTSSRHHWAGDGNGTEFFLSGREYTTPQTSWRWTGMRTIQDIALKAYAQVYPNLRRHGPSYPTPKELLSKVKIGNIDFEGEMDHDTDGSNLIRSLLLNEDPRPLYLQAWGGTSAIACALKSVEEQYSNSRQWAQTKDIVSRKAVILASGFQDETYADYIALNWPQIRVEQLAGGQKTWTYNCEFFPGYVRGLPADHVYFTGGWIKANIQTGPYGKLYRSWLDGQSMPGDPEDIFGDPAKAASSDWCKPLGPYDFLSEGDNVAFNPLLSTDQFKVGVLVSLIFIAGSASSVAGGLYSAKTKRVRPPLMASMGLFVIYFACMATIKLNQSDAIWGFTVLAGLGLGFGLVIAVTTGQISTPPGLIATTSGLILTSRSLGGSVALPIYTAILSSLLSKNLGPKVAERVLPLGLSSDNLPAFISALANNDQKALARIPGVNPDIISAGLLGLKTAYRIAFRGIWSAAAAISAVGFILALFVTDPRKSFNMHVDAPVEHELALKLHVGREPTGTSNEATGTANDTLDTTGKVTGENN